MKSIYLLVSFLIFSLSNAFSQCTVSFTVSRTNCNYVFTDNTSSSYGIRQHNWYYNNTLVSTAGATFSATLTNGDSICESINTANYTNCGRHCYVIGCGPGCPTINQNFSTIDSGLGGYTFVDSSFGQDTSATYSWLIDGVTYAGSTVTVPFTTNGVRNICETITEPHCAAPYVLCKNVSIGGICATFSTQWIDSPYANQPFIVQFTDSSHLTDPTATYTWTFGDSTSYSSVNFNRSFTHQYRTSGRSYYVCESISQPGCPAHTFCDSVFIPCPSHINPSWTLYSRIVDTFTLVDASTGQDSSAFSVWSFGDGNTAQGKRVTHVYNPTAPTIYRICDTVHEPNCSSTFVSCNTVSVFVCPAANALQNYTYTRQSNSGTYTFNDANSWLQNYSVYPTYKWLWGDGTTTTGPTSTSHTYGGSGNYRVCEVVSISGCAPDTICQNINVYTCPYITQSWYDNYVNNQGQISFVDNSSGADANATYSWNFGDGHYGSGTNPTHTYTANGSYIITETITEPGCTPYTLSHWLNNLTICPVINQNFTYIIGQNGQYTFIDSSTGQDANATYSWTWGDGTSGGSGSTCYHTYYAPGSYWVMETILEPGACPNYNVSHQINVIILVCPNASSSFQATDHGGGAFTFSDQSFGTDASTTYSWDFGDGQMGTGSPVNHAYTSSALLTVCETISEPLCPAYSPVCNAVSVDIHGAGISQIAEPNIRIYPNPASTVLNVDPGIAAPGEINISNTLGQSVLGNIPLRSGAAAIDISTLSNGAYTLTVKVDGQILHRQFVISK